MIKTKKENGSSFKLKVSVIIALILIGTLLVITVETVKAGDFLVKKMPVIIEIDDNRTIAEKITMKLFKSEEVKIGFEAKIMNCKSSLDIIAIDENENIYQLSPDSISVKEQDSGCLVSGTLILTSETQGEDYILVFLSPGKDKYGNNQEISEILRHWQILKGKDKDQIIAIIRDDTVDSAGSGDSMAVKYILVELLDISIDIERREWFYAEWPYREKKGIKIYGTSNLPEGTLFEWKFSGTFGEISGVDEVKWDGKIEFLIDTAGEIEAGKYNLVIWVEKFGKFFKEFPVIIKPTIQPTPTPKPTSMIRPSPAPSPIPTSIPKDLIITPRPETSIEISDIVCAFTSAMIVVFLKRKNSRDK